MEQINIIAQIYYLLWSGIAIAFGMGLLFFRKRFLDANANRYLKLYEKTNFYPFKKSAEEMKKSYMHILVPFIGLMLIFAGIYFFVAYI